MGRSQPNPGSLPGRLKPGRSVRCLGHLGHLGLRPQLTWVGAPKLWPQAGEVDAEAEPERSSRHHLGGHLHVGDQIVATLVNEPETVVELDELLADNGAIGGPGVRDAGSSDLLDTPGDGSIVWIYQLAHRDLGQLVGEVLGDAAGRIAREN